MNSSLKIDKETVRKLDVAGPRYTSYPTAPEWDNAFPPAAYIQKLADFRKTDKTLSLYIHIPFCETLCYFCACTMAIRQNDDKYGNEYIDFLEKELDLISQHIGPNRTVRQLHWGGGTPSFLSEAQIERLFAKIQSLFTLDFTGELAIEVDPRRVTQNKVKTLRQLGFNRISIGLQDFDPDVQKNVNRIQPFEDVRRFTQWCRDVKFESINFDLIYGLPYQTKTSFHKTVAQTLSLKPDRIALYSFALVPWLKKHQGKLDQEKIPTGDEKLEIFLEAREQFMENGYDAIAMDHFAMKNDDLAKAFREGSLYRNFMGYTVKPADEYIGVGTSSIGFIENTYVQNHKTIPEYYDALRQGVLPIERGKILSEDDQIRRWVINGLMCQFHIDKNEFTKTFRSDFDEYFKNETPHIHRCQDDGLLKNTATILTVTDLGKIFIRNICMGFDWYLQQKQAHRRFSRTV